MFDFTDMTVMITGGTGNLGQATARAFATSGARVAVVDRNREKQLSLYADWAGSDRHILASSFDVTEAQGAEAAVGDVVSRTGSIDVLINAIGGYQGGEATADTSPETWDGMMTLNARAVFLVCRAMIPHMLEQGGGKIVNVSARTGVKGSARNSAYAASKSAVISLTETMAAELQRKGINVNCVVPSTIDTPENREAMPDADASRWVQAESLAAVIQFLASEAARDVHGAALPVFGRS